MLGLARFANEVFQAYDSAIALTSCVLSLVPDDPVALHCLALTYNLSDKPDAAVDMCNRIVENYPGFRPAYTTLGVTYNQLGDTERAFEILALANSKWVNHPGFSSPWLEFKLAAANMTRRCDFLGRSSGLNPQM